VGGRNTAFVLDCVKKIAGEYHGAECGDGRDISRPVAGAAPTATPLSVPGGWPASVRITFI
jgi:hypothetical protein